MIRVIDSAATIEFSEQPTPLFSQILGIFTGEFVSWIPGIRCASPRLSLADVQIGRNVTLAMGPNEIVASTITWFKPSDFTVAISIVHSRKLQRSYEVHISEIGTSSILNLSMKSKLETGLFGPKPESEKAQLKATLSNIKSFHASGKIGSVGFD